jgi:chromosome segregation ATPase
MSEPTTVTYSLEKLLSEIQSDLKELRKDVNRIETKVSVLTEKMEGMDKRMEGMDKRLEKVELTQNDLVKEVSDLKGVKSLIVPVIVALITAAMTLVIRVIPLG